MKVFKNFLQILNFRTLFVVVLSLSSTYVSLHLQIIAEMPMGLLGIAIVFPIVFSINAAYRRREEALVYLSSIKSFAVSFFYAHRDWASGNTKEHTDRVVPILLELFQSIQEYFGRSEEKKEDLEKIYSLFSQLSLSSEELRDAGVSMPEMSRLGLFLHFMMAEFEKMRNIFIYRTPISLKTYTGIVLKVLPVLFGPYFAYFSDQYFWSYGFFVAALYSIILVSLDNIQDSLENPYDGIGNDDIDLKLTDQYRKIFSLK